MSRYGYVDKEDLFTDYLREIGRYPLLTIEEEKIYGTQVHEMMLHEEVRRKLKISVEEYVRIRKLNYGLIKEVYERGEAAKEWMIKCNLRLVVAVAKRYNTINLQIYDMVQEGNIGLIRGVEKYNPVDYPVKFSTYACVPTSTQILTRRGWLYWNEVIPGQDETLGYDFDTGCLAWTNIKGVTDYDDAPLMRFGNEHWSTVCTPNHKWLANDPDGVRLRPIEDWMQEKTTSQMLVGAPYGGDDVETRVAVKCMLGSYKLQDVRYFRTNGRGHVWCPSTGLETWLSKSESGDISISGNTWWIKESINKGISSTGRTIRLPVHVTDKIRAVRRANKDFFLKHGRYPTRQEMTDITGIKDEMIQKIMAAIKKPSSLNICVETAESTALSFLEYVPDPESMFDDAVVQSDVQLILHELLECLTDKEREVLARLRGLFGVPRMSKEELAESFGVCPGRVKQIERAAIKKLREEFTAVPEVRDMLAACLS